MPTDTKGTPKIMHSVQANRSEGFGTVFRQMIVHLDVW